MKMEKVDFAAHLQLATVATLVFTRTQCWNRLPDKVEYIIRPDGLDEDAPHLNELEIRLFKMRKQEMSKRFTAEVGPLHQTCS